MKVLIDTNVLLLIANEHDPKVAIAEAALSSLRREGARLYIVPQVIYEFWTAATKTISAKGHSTSTNETAGSCRSFFEISSFVDDPLAV